ncbi:MAG: polymer-forming cytoskeletal protein [Erysipelotrichales bacterium]|nr:polymer-forming cytoskeletal protein [Erysipelotrichales bacterium]
MFNFKEKLNQFLDDLEEVEEGKEVSPEASADNFKAKQEELSNYLATLKSEKEAVAAAPVISQDQPKEIVPPTIKFEEIKEEPVNVTIKNNDEPITIPLTHNSETCVLTDDLVIVGDLITTDPLQMNGTVHGNINSKSRVVIYGTVEGDIKAQSASINSSIVNGNISAEENIVITGESQITGDIFNKSIAIDGILNGSIHATGKVKINPNAEIYGNVSAASIAMEEGAIVQGNVRINTPKR